MTSIKYKQKDHDVKKQYQQSEWWAYESLTYCDTR